MPNQLFEQKDYLKLGKEGGIEVYSSG